MEVKKKGKFQTFIHGCLQRSKCRFDLETFGILETWLLGRGGRLGGLTVYYETFVI